MIHTLALLQLGGFNAELVIPMGVVALWFCFIALAGLVGPLRSVVRTWLWLLVLPLFLCHRVVASQNLRDCRQQWGFVCLTLVRRWPL